MPKYLVTYTSAVTGNRITSGYPDLTMARRDVVSLEKEGCKNVVLSYVVKEKAYGKGRSGL